MDHAEDLATERREELDYEYRQIEAAAKDEEEIPSWQTFISIYGKILTNCFCLRSDR